MPAKANTTRDGHSNPVVLVVDDDRDFADTCEYWLRGGRHEVRTAYDGESAIEAVDDTVDVVLLDRRMPGMSGDEVLDRIRDQDIDCRVAMLTAVEPDTDIIDMPFDEYLVKPVTRSEVRETVADLLARGSFEEDVQEHLALEATERVLDSHNVDDIDVSDRDVSPVRRELLERRHRDITRLSRLNAVIRDVHRAIVDAASREELETEVCESLVAADPYLVAAAIEHSPATDTLTTDVVVGVDEIDLDPIESLLRDALERHEVVVGNDLSDQERDALFPPDSAGTMVGVVPLTYRDTVYGVLVVGAADEHAFTDREIEVFTDLGRSIGNGFNAVAQRRLLAADTLVELEFQHADDADPFVAATSREECSIELDGFAPSAGGGVTCFISVTEAPAEELTRRIGDLPSVEGVRVVAESTEEALLEVDVAEGCIVHTLVEYGANVRSLQVSNGRGYLTATVAADANYSAVVDAVTSAFPDTELEAKREVDRQVRTSGGFGDDVDRQLTDRQRDVLEAAYASGYFKWPRESTAEEVAESLNISPPTFHEHLRTAQQELLEVYLGEVQDGAETGIEPESEPT